jgi:hypothetical protein
VRVSWTDEVTPEFRGQEFREEFRGSFVDREFPGVSWTDEVTPIVLDRVSWDRVSWTSFVEFRGRSFVDRSFVDRGVSWTGVSWTRSFVDRRSNPHRSELEDSDGICAATPP